MKFLSPSVFIFDISNLYVQMRRTTILGLWSSRMESILPSIVSASFSASCPRMAARAMALS